MKTYEVISEEYFLVLCFHLYISNLYIIEAKVLCHRKAVFIYYWGVLKVFHYGGTGGISQKMAKYPPVRVPPPYTKFLFSPHKNLSPPPYCYLK